MIKCKAKSTGNGKWLYGYYVYKVYPDPQLNTHLIVVGFEEFEVDAVTVCRSTDQTDKNGKDIYENDIKREEFPISHLKGIDHRIYYVCIWIKEWSRFAWLSYGELIGYESRGIKELDESMQETYGVFESEREKTTIVDNYIDNPELLLKEDEDKIVEPDDDLYSCSSCGNNPCTCEDE